MLRPTFPDRSPSARPQATALERSAGWGLRRTGITIRAWIGTEAVETTVRDSLGVALLANSADGVDRVTSKTLSEACAEGSTCAYAWWDGETQTLRWGRDWLGSAALFGSLDDEDFVIGGSCLAVARMAGRHELDPEVLQGLYRGQFDTSGTGVLGVVRAPRVRLPVAPVDEIADADAPGALLDAMRDVIGSVLESSSRCACLLSGGIDSAAIAAVLVEQARRLGKPEPVLLTASYPGLSEDETEWARIVARHLDAPWIARTPSDEVPLDGIPGRTALYGGPLVDPEDEEMAALYRAARSEGCDVVLTGHGAEILLGVHGLDVDLLRAGRLGDAWRLVRSFAAAVNQSPVQIFPRSSVRQALRRRPWNVDPAALLREPDVQRAVSRTRIEGPNLPWAYEMGCRTNDVQGVTMVHPLFSRRVWSVAGCVTRDALLGDGTFKALLRAAVDEMLPVEITGRVRKARHNRTHRGRHQGARDRWARTVEALRANLGPVLGPPPDTESLIDHFFRTSQGMGRPWLALCIGEFVRQTRESGLSTQPMEVSNERPARRHFLVPEEGKDGRAGTGIGPEALRTA